MKPEKQTLQFRGRIITVTTDEVVLPNGYRAELEVVHHPGGAAVVAIDAQERVCLLRQYRYVADGWIWELPAGKLEPNEPPLETAKRELIEEAGTSARHWESLGTVFSRKCCTCSMPLSSSRAPWHTKAPRSSRFTGSRSLRRISGP